MTIDTHRSTPVTSDHRGLFRWITQRRNRLSAQRRILAIRTRADDLDDTANWLLSDYTRAVKNGADRHELSAILTGISGCLLAQSACWYARGYLNADKAEEYRLSGLVIAEVAACASENPSRSDPPPYRGPRAPMFQAQEITDALHELAQSYQGPLRAGLDGDDLVVWGCLSELIEQVSGVVPGTWVGPQFLADLSDAHFTVEQPAPPVGLEGAEPARKLEHIQTLIEDLRHARRWTKIYLGGSAVAGAVYLAALIASSSHPSFALDLTQALAVCAVTVLVVTGVVTDTRRTLRQSRANDTGGAE